MIFSVSIPYSLPKCQSIAPDVPNVLMSQVASARQGSTSGTFTVWKQEFPWPAAEKHPEKLGDIPPPAGVWHFYRFLKIILKDDIQNWAAQLLSVSDSSVIRLQTDHFSPSRAQRSFGLLA